MRVSVIGAGYVGLVTGTCIASFGNDVTFVEADEDKLGKLLKGVIPIHEPGLEERFKRNHKRMHFVGKIDEQVASADVVFLCVGTPSAPDGSVDMSAVKKASLELIRKLPDGKKVVIVSKSTVPIGTCSHIQALVDGDRKSAVVISNPEFLREGCAVGDFMRPDRIVIGTGNEYARELMADLYSPFVREPRQLIFMDTTAAAEMTKYATNAMLTTRISFMNELAALAEMHGVDINDVRVGLGTDSRIGNQFLYPGIGFGGSCFGKDARGLISQGNKEMLSVVHSALVANHVARERFRTKIRCSFPGLNMGVFTIGVLGLAFKPETDDVRESPALWLVQRLLEDGFRIRVFDPVAMENASRELLAFAESHIYEPDLIFCDDLYDVANGANALVLCTEWQQFRRPDWGKVEELMSGRLIFDGRNVWNREKLSYRGFSYYGPGRDL